METTTLQKETYLIKQAFRHLNTFKRYRAMNTTSRDRGNTVEADRLELQMFKTFDQLELSLRGLQNELRRSETTIETTESTEQEN